MSRDLDLQELDIQADLERLLDAWDGGRDGSDTLDREVLEVLGLMPYALPPEEPRAGLKGEILARIGTAGIGQSPGLPAQSAPPSLPFEEVPAAADFASHRARREVVARSPANHQGRWAMAAVLGACLLGLGYFGGRVGELTRLADRLNGDLAAARTQPLLPENMHDQFSIIRTIAPQAYPMRPADNKAAQINGMVYVCPKHEAWSINLNGLEDPPPGFEYRLWFLTDQGAKAGDILHRGEQGQFELAAPHMPLGTHSFGVSRERIGEVEPGHPGQWVLRAESPIRL